MPNDPNALRPEEPGGTADRPESFSLSDLGLRLKNLRRVRGLPLQLVAESVGVSPSFLSMVERGQSDISLSRFSRLAEFYGISLSELLLENQSDEQVPDLHAIADFDLIERGAGVAYRVVRSDQPQVIHVVMQGMSAFPDLKAHPGEDFWIVVRGRADLLYGSRRYELAAGQVARFSGVIPHGFENPYREQAELIAVATVPYW